MPKTLIGWSESFFFVLRLRSLSGWLKRLGWAVGISAIVFGLLQAFGGPRPFLVEVEISLAIGFLLTLLPDIAMLQRDVSITEQAIDWETPHVQLSFHGSLPHASTASIELLRPGEWRYRFAGMKVVLADGREYLFAVSPRKKLETIATLLARLEIPVTLSDWEPTTADTRMKVEDEVSLDALPASTRDAVFTPIPPEEPKLVSTGGMVFAALVGAGPTLLALLAMIGTWVYLGIYWSELSVTDRVIIGAGGVAGFILAFAYMLFIGQFIEKSLLVNMAGKSLRTRLEPVVDVADENMFAVSFYNRESWTKVVSKSVDFGFLQVNRHKRAIVFEGGKERWIIPLTALTSVRIEEAAVGKEGGDPSEIRYYVVIGAWRDGAEWEVGLIHARTKWGHDGAKARRQRTGELFDEIRTAIESA